MGKYVGLVWATKGWFGVVLGDDSEYGTDLFPSIWSLWKYHSDATRILVDVPIGLPSETRRACDVAAKRKLGRQQSRVFYAPVREAIYQGNLDEAKERNERAGYSIQNQAWSVVPRIREVDEFLDMYPSARDRLSETHPELCFYTLNGRAAVSASKQTEAGRQRRTELLADEHPAATTICEAAIDRYTTPSYAPMVGGPEDVLDALAAAVTARRDPENLSTLPADPPEDDRGLPMRIVYPSDTRQTRLSTIGSNG
jgi:predicted RNase H-like nuclease